MASRKYTSRFRETPEKKEEFTLNRHEREPMNFSKKMVIWTPVVIAFLVGAYFLKEWLTG